MKTVLLGDFEEKATQIVRLFCWLSDWLLDCSIALLQIFSDQGSETEEDHASWGKKKVLAFLQVTWNGDRLYETSANQPP